MTLQPSLPLTAGQAGLWYAQQLAGPNATFNAGACLEIAGPLDVAAFEAAMWAVLGETEALRVRIEDGPAGLRQSVLPVVDRGQWPVEVLDLPGADAARAWMDADMNRPAELDRPLFRWALLRAGPDLSFWYYRYHHVVMDGMGAVLVARRLAAVYTALVAGAPVTDGGFGPLATLVAGDEAYRGSDTFAADRDFWLDRLRDRAEPATLAGKPAGLPQWLTVRTGSLEPAEAEQVRALGLGRSVSWPAVLVAGLVGYLHRVTGEPDVTVALSVGGRVGTAALSVPGMVSNVVPVRLRVGPATGVGELVTAAAAELRAATRHQRYRHEDLRRDLGLLGRDERLLGPRLNISTQSGTLLFGDLPAVSHPISHGQDDDLSVVVFARADGGMRVELTANPDLYADADVDRHLALLLGWLRTLCAADPATPIGRLDLDPAAVPAVPAPDEPVTETLVSLFARRVAAAPGAVAVTDTDGGTTYGELDAAAGALARVLAARGAGPERCVALALPRDRAMVVAILATLRTGAAYLPLDPDYPDERVAAMFADARPVLLLASGDDRAAAVAATAGVPVLDPAAPTAAGAAADPAGPAEAGTVVLPGRIDPATPAYVIFTSGSTGRPKGVVVTHANVVRLFTTTEEHFGFGPDDVWTLFHSFAFDFSVWELWGALLHGGRVVVVDRQVTRAPEEFLRLLAAERVTVLSQTPSAFSQLVQADRDDPATGDRLALRRVVFGGEALDPSRLADWYDRHPDHAPVLVNMYGITETTVHVTHLRLDAAAAAAGGSPVGVGLPDLRVHVLDAALRPTAAGLTGELYVGGAGVARGYLARPDLTAQRMVADPYGPAGARLYRTGDLARRVEGGLEYLGRADDQVQLRGFRVELGDVTAAVRAASGAGQVAVVVREDNPGDQRLVAYVVGEVDPELRARVAARLPDYMVPSAFVALPELPLTANGKLDRRALPAAERARDGAGRPAASPVEELLCGLFADVLGVPQVAATDSFFDLGGHSLLATRLVSRIRTALDAELPIRAVFETPTVEGLAARLAAPGTGAARAALLPRPRPERVPLSYAQRRLWFLNRVEGTGAYNIPLVLRLTGPLDVAALQDALEDLGRRHESLRTVFPERDGQPWQHVLDSTVHMRPELVDADGREVDAAVEAAAGVGFDLRTDPPVRSHLFRTGADAHTLLVVLHHVAGDGWSLAPMARDLRDAYEARRDGGAPVGPPLPVQYVDYTLWQYELLGAEDDADSPIARQLAYWTATLAGLPEEATLPTDRSRPAVPSHRGDTVEVTVPAGLRSELERVAAGHGASLFMVVHAAVATLLTRHGAGDDVPLGTAIAGRTDEALDELIGFFVNTLVLRTDTAGDPTFAELLARVRTVVLAAFAHQDLPFQRLVEELNPDRSAARNPLTQVVLAFQNTPEPDLALPGLETEMGTAGTGAAKLDLFLDVRDDPAGGLACRVEYATELYDRDTVTAFAQRLVVLLGSVARDPDARLSALDWLRPGELSALVDDTSRPIPAASVAEQVAGWAARTPDAAAVVSGGETLTYRELDGRADRLARQLAARGVGPEDRVALALPRSVSLVVAMLAVAKAGAAYVPLDPEYPADRIGWVLADSRPALLLTTTPVAAALPGTAAPVLLLDGGAGTGPDDADPPLAVRRHPLHPAYAIYTSGSTGRPKGVVVPGQALVNFLAGMAELVPLTPADRWLAVTTISFDISNLEVWLPLTSGATVLLAGRNQVLDPEALVELAAAQRATVLQATPSLWQALVSAAVATPAGTATLRGLRMLVGGEAVPARLAAAMAAHGEVLDVYGPTETTIWSTATRLDGTAPPTIGRPIANTTAHVLDPTLRPVPAGVPGELYLGGAGLARGYFGRPDLTAARFVADPYGSPGQRLYRTGDLVRRLPTGELDFLGRVDEQVKLRGFRIEPAEVVTVLTGHPAVDRAAVVVREDRPGDRRLVGYVVPAPGVLDERDAGSEAAELERWDTVWSMAYADGEATDPTPLGQDFSGWLSSYDGRPIPLAQMRRWRAETVDRILALRPRRVLELGVGTGLLLAEVAPHCEAYFGTDLSAEVIGTLGRKVGADPALADRVRLAVQPAHQVTGLPWAVDVIVLNSVAQYFPSADYLLEVIGNSVDLLADGGALFLGDIRRLRLLDSLQASIRYATDPEEDPGRRRRAVAQDLTTESELLLEPEFFTRLAAERAGVGAVDIQVKRGGYDNELSRYRYDVVLHKRPAAVLDLGAAPVLEWTGADTLEAALSRPGPVRVTGIPNPRLAADLAVLRETGGAPVEGPDPDLLYDLAERSGRRVAVTWAPADLGELDAVFAPAGPEVLTGSYVGTDTGEPANRPGLARRTVALLTDLRSHAAEQLPDYMVPAALVPLDALPLTPNGKLDRSRLPAPDFGATVSDRKPTTPTEKALCAVLAEVLGLARVGVDDDFFRVGGDSITSVQLVSRARAAGVPISVQDVLAYRTAAALAEVADAAGPDPATDLTAELDADLLVSADELDLLTDWENT